MRFFVKISLYSCLFSLLAVNSWGQQDSQDSIAAIARQINVPAIQVVHVKDGKTYSYIFGKKNNEEEALITENTVFQAASLTKVVTAYVFFRLYDKGLISLDKPLWDYYHYDRLANTPGKERITARMVLTHRTGFLNWEGDVSTKEWRASALHLQFEPGTKYSYSGEGFYFLQLVMEHLTGKTLQQLADQEVLQPFGMDHSQMSWQDGFLEDCAYGHYPSGKPRKLGQYRYINAAYTLYTTATDYTSFVQKALNEGKGLKRKTYLLMTSKAADVQKADTVSWDDKYVPIALGMRIQLNEKGKWLWHTGSNPGFRCFFITNPATKESLAAFINSDNGMEAMQPLMQLFLEKGQTFWAYDWRKGELD